MSSCQCHTKQACIPYYSIAAHTSSRVWIFSDGISLHTADCVLQHTRGHGISLVKATRSSEDKELHDEVQYECERAARIRFFKKTWKELGLKYARFIHAEHLLHFGVKWQETLFDDYSIPKCVNDDEVCTQHPCSQCRPPPEHVDEPFTVHTNQNGLILDTGFFSNDFIDRVERNISLYNFPAARRIRISTLEQVSEYQSDIVIASFLMERPSGPRRFIIYPDFPFRQHGFCCFVVVEGVTHFVDSWYRQMWISDNARRPPEADSVTAGDGVPSGDYWADYF